MNRAVKWEIASVLFIFFIGSLLHFTYAWSGYSKIVAVFSATNESVWEHLKMAFWPGLLFALIEYPFHRSWAKNFWAAKAVGLTTTPVLICVIWYGYTLLAGRHFLAADIATFLVAVILGQRLSYLLMSHPEQGRSMRVLGKLLICALTAVFWFFTYCPPRTKSNSAPMPSWSCSSVSGRAYVT